METTAKTHPILIIAAISVILFSLVGIGAVTGLIPSSHSEKDSSASVAPVSSVPPAANDKLALNSPSTYEQPIPQAALEPKPAAPARNEVRDTQRAPVKTHTHAEKHVEKPKNHTEPKHHTHTAVKTVPSKHVSSHKDSVVAANEVGQMRDVGATPVRSCSNCGVIESVNAVKEPGQGSPLGAIAGGVIGGLLGHQVGKGNGNTVATVAGAAGGAYAGHEIEKRVRTTSSWDVTVRMDNGDVRHFSLPQQPGYLPGDKVKVVDGQIVNG